MEMDEDTDLLSFLNRADQAKAKYTLVPKPCDDGAARQLVNEPPVNELRRKVIELEHMLVTKDKVCKSLKATLENLVSNMGEGLYDSRGSISLAETIRVPPVTLMVHCLSREYFEETMKSWSGQVWFRASPPDGVKAVFTSLIPQLNHIYEIDKRKTAVTMTECIRMVDKLRKEWEITLPQNISRSLQRGTLIYTSKSDARDDIKGQPCEAVHYLAYLARKMFNLAASMLLEVKKKDAISNSTVPRAFGDLSGSSVLNNLNSVVSSSVEREIKSKWYDNLSIEGAVATAMEAANNSKLSNAADVESVITLTVEKLVTGNKPKLGDALNLLASIIGLQKYAANQGWEIPDSILLHRQVLPFKMAEVWNNINYRLDWNSYRGKLFSCINSFVGYMYLCRGIDGIQGLLDTIAKVVKPGHRILYQEAVKVLTIENNFVPLFKFLELFKDNQDYFSFYGNAYVSLIQFISMVKVDNTILTESILINLLVDANISKDISKLSKFEESNHVKAISIISTSMITKSIKSIVAVGDRKKYAEAAVFLGSRFKYLILSSKLNKVEEERFWEEEPLIGYSLSAYYEEERINHNVLKMIEQISLPAFHPKAVLNLIEKFSESEFDIPDEVTNVKDTKMPEKDTLKDALNTASNDISPSHRTVKGLTVAEMRQILKHNDQSHAGKKKELQDRLIQCCGYSPKEFSKGVKRNLTTSNETAECKRRKSNENSKQCSESSDESSE